MHLRQLALAGTLTGALLTAGPLASQTPQSRSYVEDAVSDSVWYDADERSVVPVEVEPVVDDSEHRDSRWLPKAKRVRQSATPAAGGGGGGAGGGGTGIFGSGLSIGNLFGWLLLIVLIGTAVGMLIYFLGKTEVDPKALSRSKRNKLDGSPDEQTIERMKHLPAELRRTDVNLRTEAERLMKEGQYDQAIILLFGHQLLLLDHVGMLRLNRGKTNRRYVRESRSANRDAATCLAGTVAAFERSYFGRHEITQREFADLWQANGELERTVETQREVAA